MDGWCYNTNYCVGVYDTCFITSDKLWIHKVENCCGMLIVNLTFCGQLVYAVTIRCQSSCLF